MALINSKLKFPFADSAYTVRTIQGDESTTKTLLSLSGMYDPWIIRILEQYIHEDFVCFDVGANIGIVSIDMSLLASRGRVFAFEASKRNFDLLNENLQLK